MKRALAVVVGLVTVAVGALFMPQPQTLSSDVSGDTALIEQVRAGLPAGPFDRLSVAVIDGDSVETANFGATGETEYEVGSVSKTFTATLFAIAIERGEVTEQTTLGSLLYLGDSPAASVTLGDIATHHSGLPRLPGSILPLSLLTNYTGGDPYPYSVDELVEQARGVQVSDEPKFEYSNLGFALLGQALAAAAGTDYETLLESRVTEPLGLTDTFAPTVLPPDATTGLTATGRHSDPWVMPGYGPAGSIRSTLDDMVDYVIAQRDETAPGVEATEPRTDAGESSEIGWAWITTGPVTWHNGMTGGFASFVGFDRESGRAVVILSGSAVSLDDLAFALLEDS